MSIASRQFRLVARLGLALALLTAAVRAASADVAVFKIDIGLPNTVAVMVRGQFSGNEILRFKAAIADIDPHKRIIAILDSPGGDVIQGEALGRFFYDAKIPTMVLAGTLCASACTYAFFGGRSPTTGNPLRILASGAKLGFHRVAPVNLPDKAYTKAELENFSRETQQIVYRNLQHLIYVRAPLEVLKLNTGTTNDQINFITEGDALSYGIAVLDRQTGNLVLPDNIDQRTRREER
ncbi:MAG TPA: hypothetical protein VK438_14675 [Xanthobacteraceae bacterium]|nr:hypothetical protein [Xanthobacteraceae bacterium]